jgi:GT2 family glycosyltransferase
MAPLIYAIVLNWRQYELTSRCLHSLLELNYVDCRIVMIDNGSDDGSARRLQEEFGSSIIFISNSENLGFAGGNNVGIRYALEQGANYVLLLNNDTIVDADFLRPLVEALEKDKQVGAATPKIYFLEESGERRLWAAGGRVSMWLGLSGNRGRGEIDVGQFDKLEEVAFGSGCCLLMRREVLEQVGLLNEAYFAYYEDLDWCYGARAKGYKILYVPRSKIWHAAGASSKSPSSSDGEGALSAFVYYLVTRNHLWFIRTYVHGPRRIAALAVYLSYSIMFYSAAFIILRRWRKLRECWRGFKDGITCSPNDYDEDQNSDGRTQ